MPKISVIMPVYNAEKYLKEAIDSILNQTYSDFEYIIIDDGSHDSSVDIVCSYTDERIRFYKNDKNIGVAATLNKGLDLAKGEYIARMDADDISLPTRLEKQVIYMDNNKDIAVLGCGVQFFGARTGTQVFSKTSEQLKVDTLFCSCFAHPSVMMRSSLFGKGKMYYDPKFDRVEDYELWVRTCRNYNIAAIQEVLIKYRIHNNQVTQQITDDNKQKLRRLKELQLLDLGIIAEEKLYRSFLAYCTGEKDFTIDEVLKLSSLFSEIIKNNEVKLIYSKLELKNTLDLVIERLLGNLSISQAVLVAKKCNNKYILYIIKRVVRSIILRTKKIICTVKLQSKFKNKKITIISNNCWGGMIYTKYGLKYQTPTVGLYILGKDFVKLCANWQDYFSKELQFIPWENSSFYHVLKESKPYPVAMLGDIEIYFMHYFSENEAKDKWERRIKRIHPEHMLFKLSQREGCSKEDIEKFMNLPIKNKICFAYDSVPGTIHVPELKSHVGDETPIINQYFEELTVLNNL